MYEVGILIQALVMAHLSESKDIYIRLAQVVHGWILYDLIEQIMGVLCETDNQWTTIFHPVENTVLN